MTRSPTVGWTIIALGLLIEGPARAAVMPDGSTIETGEASDCCVEWESPVCQVIREVIVDAGAHLDFGSRTLMIREDAGFNAPYPGSVTIDAGTIEVDVGGYMSATCDAERCGDLTVRSDENIVVNGTMELVSNHTGGNLVLEADGSITITRPIEAHGGGAASQGGTVTIESGDNLIVDAIDVSGSNGEGLSGGEVLLQSNNGLDVLGDIDASGASGGSISIWSYGVVNINDVILTTQTSRGGGWAGSIDIRTHAELSTATGSEIKARGSSNKHNSGGVVFLRSAGAMVLNGSIDVSPTGGAGTTESAGGSVRIDSGSSISLSDFIEADSPDNQTHGGRVMLSAVQGIIINFSINLEAGSEGGIIDMLALDDIQVSANLSAEGRAGPGGQISIISRSGTVNARENVVANGHSDSLGGAIELEGCRVVLHTETHMTTMGAGGTNRLAGAEFVSVSTGIVEAGLSNTIEYAGSPPVIPEGAHIVPVAAEVLNPSLGRCMEPVEPTDIPRPLCDVDGDGFADRRLGGNDCDDSDASVHPGSEGDPCLCGPVPLLRWGETAPAECATDPYPVPFSLPEACVLPEDTGAPIDTGDPSDTGEPPVDDTGEAPVDDTGEPAADDTGEAPVDDTSNPVAIGKGTPGKRVCGCASSPVRTGPVWLLFLGLLIRRRQ